MHNKLLTIDSTFCRSELCELGAKYPTDKSPINNNPSLHKHAYTAIYNLIFARLKNNSINIAEIGIFNNMSMHCWREFFPQATLYGLEYNQNLINKANNDNLKNTTYSTIDVRNKDSISTAFDKLNCKMDIIIDDSTHQPAHQINVIQACINYLNTGGYLIIEDLFKKIDLTVFTSVLDTMLDVIGDYFFIDANHQKKFSGTWNNDRLLIIVKK